MSLGGTIKMARERRGWSQRELAERTGLTHTSVSRIESGRIGELRTDALGRLASVLDLSADYLLGLSSSPYSEVNARDSTVAELLALFRQLEPERRNAVLDFTEFELRQQLGQFEDDVTEMREAVAAAAQMASLEASASGSSSSDRIQKRNQRLGVDSILAPEPREDEINEEDLKVLKKVFGESPYRPKTKQT